MIEVHDKAFYESRTLLILYTFSDNRMTNLVSSTCHGLCAVTWYFTAKALPCSALLAHACPTMFYIRLYRIYLYLCVILATDSSGSQGYPTPPEGWSNPATSHRTSREDSSTQQTTERATNTESKEMNILL